MPRVVTRPQTARAGDGEERIRSAGANAYVSKPISLARFMEEVRALVPPDAEEEAPLASDDSPGEDQPETEA